MLNTNAKIPNITNSANEAIVIAKNTIMARSASIFVKLSIPKQIIVPIKPTSKPARISIKNILTKIISLAPIVKIYSNYYCTNTDQQTE